jgi:cytochrome c oxidase assembly protein subunit 17
VETDVDGLNPEGVKPCCACPVTKRKRDDCFMRSPNGEVECKELIEAHREYPAAEGRLIRCMAGFGFKV